MAATAAAWVLCTETLVWALQMVSEFLAGRFGEPGLFPELCPTRSILHPAVCPGKLAFVNDITWLPDLWLSFTAWG